MSAGAQLEGLPASLAWPGDGHCPVSHPQVQGPRGGWVLGSACISQMLTAGGSVGHLCEDLGDFQYRMGAGSDSVPHVDISTRHRFCNNQNHTWGPHCRTHLINLQEINQVTRCLFLQICRVPTGFVEARAPPGPHLYHNVLFTMFYIFHGLPSPRGLRRNTSVSLSAPGPPFRAGRSGFHSNQGDQSCQAEAGCQAFVFLSYCLKSKVK